MPQDADGLGSSSSQLEKGPGHMLNFERLSACAGAWQLLAALASARRGRGVPALCRSRDEQRPQTTNNGGQIDNPNTCWDNSLHLDAVHSACGVRSTCRRYRAAMPLIVSRAAYEVRMSTR
ncbi:hypothetical protein HDV57DRAFT_255202 [Trichoderma longibrachiatum]